MEVLLSQYVIPFIGYMPFCRCIDKKISKKKSIKCRDGWMEALADKVQKQREHIPQHHYISHNHRYISSSEYCAN